MEIAANYLQHPFYIVTYYVKWVTAVPTECPRSFLCRTYTSLILWVNTSWTYTMTYSSQAIRKCDFSSYFTQNYSAMFKE